MCQPDAGDVQTANNATVTVQKAFDDYKIEREKTDADKARQNQSQLQAQVNLAEYYRQQADKLSGELLAKGKELTLAQQKLKEKSMNSRVKMAIAGLVSALALSACTSKTSAIQPDPVAVNTCQQPTAEMLDIPPMPAAPVADSPPAASSTTATATENGVRSSGSN